MNLAKLFLVVFLGTLIVSCAQDKKIKIALSKGSGSKNYANYANWLKFHNPNIEIVDLWISNRDSIKTIIDNCDGLVLTGGLDVHPGIYGKVQDTSRCELDPERDSLEFEIIEIALKKKMPVLGICRGEQILNVAKGGDLIVDIPSDINGHVQHKSSEGDSKHFITVVESSKLYKLTQTKRTMVNSAHHQAVGKIAEEFMVSARTDDGVVEAFEWNNPENKSWLMAVQWHPERLEKDHIMSKPIALEFLEEVKKYSKNK